MNNKTSNLIGLCSIVLLNLSLAACGNDSAFSNPRIATGNTDTDTVDLFREPRSGKPIGSIPLGTRVEVLGSQRDKNGHKIGWKRVKTSYEGWINEQYCPGKDRECIVSK
jgi:Bacterial SH3 domain